MLTLSLFLAASALSARPADPVVPVTAAQPNHADELGSISGKIVWEGERPAPKPDIVMDEKATTGCKHDSINKKDESLMIDDKGGVANVVLTIEVAGAEKKMPAEPIEFDQEGCHFDPHVAVVPAGATLRFANSDDTNHNLHIYPKKNEGFNTNVAVKGTLEKVFAKAEVIDIKCDIHPWMKGYIVVTDASHFAKSGADGTFTIAGLPPGDYELNWWHEELGKGKTAKVHVEAGKVATLEHKVSAKAAGGGGRRK
ncbi:MAG: hypothetical protein EXS08_11635 [Planctomycetes bacterium]|nr:hypothetical protein [Planctomycetota bacterium]